jgi:beta-alanine--pyruvate transaminase
VHSLKGEPNVIDIRNIGLVAGIELAPRRASRPSALRRLPDCFEQGVLIRTTGDIIALSPPLIIERSQIDQIVDTLRGASAAAPPRNRHKDPA